jgi:cytochrome oxidase Cu insertion factor (SCO1/SenC/PrrC family)
LNGRPLALAAALIAVAAVTGVGVGLLVHSLSSGGSGAGSDAAAEVRGQGVWPPGLRRAPRIDGLRDSDGRRFSLTALRGAPVVVAFLDSRCHQQCPLEGHALAAGMRLVPPARRPTVVVVGVNPWEDTPGSARRAMRRFGLAGFRWRWLLGSPARLRRVWRAYRVEVRRTAGDVEHTDVLYLLDSAGYERAAMVYPFLPGWVGDDLGVLAAESG